MTALIMVAGDCMPVTESAPANLPVIMIAPQRSQRY
jgi:hypothetical protein